MASFIKITTTSGFDDVKILEYYEPVTAHVVIGMNFFLDFLSSLTDVFGGKSSSYQNTLENINNQVKKELRKKAQSKGANCLLGFRIDNDEISAQGKSMMMVNAIGTPALADFPKEQSERLKEFKLTLLEDEIKRKKHLKENEIDDLLNEIDTIDKFDIISASFMNDLKSKIEGLDVEDKKLIDDAIENRQKNDESLKTEKIEFEFMQNDGELKKLYDSLNDKLNDDEIIIRIKKSNELKIIKKEKHELNKEIHLSSEYTVLKRNLKFDSK